MSNGTPAPALRHSYFIGHRGGGFFAFLPTSTGAPGLIFCVPDSKEAQGSTQNPLSSGFPFMSLWWTHRCDRCLQSAFLRQLFPRPTVRGSLDTFCAGRALDAAARRRAANRALIQMRIGMITAVYLAPAPGSPAGLSTPGDSSSQSSTFICSVSTTWSTSIKYRALKPIWSGCPL
jgi:hypothetical protein